MALARLMGLSKSPDLVTGVCRREPGLLALTHEQVAARWVVGGWVVIAAVPRDGRDELQEQVAHQQLKICQQERLTDAKWQASVASKQEMQSHGRAVHVYI
jgi:hypothetical protein